MRGGLVVLGLGLLAAACGTEGQVASTDAPTPPTLTTLAPLASPTPLPNDPNSPSCYVASVSGKDTRIWIGGTDATEQCKAVAARLTNGSWVAVSSTTPVPSGDTKTLCQGLIGQSNYKVLDHPLANFTGEAVCSQLQGPP